MNWNNIHTSLEEKIRELKGPIFVFGAGGFIGANLVELIRRYRQDCYVITHGASAAWRLKLLSIPADCVLHCDITSKGSVEHLFQMVEPGTIFNLAAYGAYSKQADVSLIYETNFLGTVNILEASKHIAAYVHAGSSSEYGLNAAGPKENGALIPNSHYSVSKISAAFLIHYYAQFFQTPAVNLRLYSIYGNWEEPDRLIPRLLELGKQGDFPPLVSPEISRDFVHVYDAVEAFLDAALTMCPLTKGKSFNIASGQKTSMRDLVSTVRNLFSIQKEPQWGSMPPRKWDVLNWYGDPSEAKHLLGWSARIELEDGLRATAVWQDEQAYAERILPAFSKPHLNRKITCVIACYKDGQAIPFMHERLVKMFFALKIRYEIIFVNDASPDNSQEVIESICARDSNVIGIQHSRNFGSQAAFLSGMEIATGDGVVLMDGDLQDPPEIIPQFHEQWVNGYDVVYGVRVKREMARTTEFFYRTFYRLFSFLSYIKIPKHAGDFSLIDIKVVKQLVTLPETEQFLRGLRAWVGFKQIGVDYVRPERMFGVSTNNWRKNIAWAKKAIFSFTFVPVEILSYVGLGITLMSVIGLATQVALKFFYSATPAGFTTLIVLILFFGGIQLLSVSIIGEYIAKIFEETKKRPKFIRTQITRGQKRYDTDAKIFDYMRNR